MGNLKDRYRVTISFNPDEYGKLLERSKGPGRGLSTWIKESIFNDLGISNSHVSQAEVLQRLYVLSHMFIWVFQSLAPNIINEKAVNELIEESKRKFPIER